MAEALLRSLGRDRVESFSAGSAPEPVHPLAVQVMAEIGIDLAARRKVFRRVRDEIRHRIHLFLLANRISGS
jgi:hypothetical protein